MQIPRFLWLAVPAALISFSSLRDASACGGCFAPPPIQESESTQVTGHRMILSVSKAQTTLWDQITYSGNPLSFGWVLPIKGTVDVGLSSDALFNTLDSQTQIQIQSPQISCSGPPFCGGGFGTGVGTGSGGFGEGSTGTGEGPPPVTVTSQKVVGPYDTVQLHSSDPAALKTWLSDHSFNLPADVAPVIDAYVADGFDFLALKLVPGQGVAAMRPVRVTTMGASPVLPLRMVAAGTGAVTPITLYVLAEGIYQPTSMPSFTITADKLVWNWDTQSSNYSVLKKAGFDGSQGKAWLMEAGESMSEFQLTSSLLTLAQTDPVGSGYADDQGMGALGAVGADLDTLFAGIKPTSLAITRLHGELTREALAGDLTLGASANQGAIQRIFQVTNTTGTAPQCPTYPPCSPTSGPSGGGISGSSGSSGNGGGGGGNADSGNGSCAMTTEGGVSPALGVFGALAAMALLRRRRR